MTAAETIRRAAREMRQTAEKATPGVWKLWGMEVRADVDGTSAMHTSLPVASTRHESGLFTFNAQHIAALGPPVALAIAAWLDTAAADWWAHGGPHCPDGCAECDDDLVGPHLRRALAVARVYLREEVETDG